MRSISILMSLVLLGIAGFAINHACADTCAGVTSPLERSVSTVYVIIWIVLLALQECAIRMARATWTPV